MLTGAIFCDSDNFVAREIKHITGEDESHVALLFGETVLHYRFMGFESMHISEFREIYNVSSILAPPQAIMVDAPAVIRKYRGGAYDFLGIIYVALFLGLRDCYGIYLPGANRLQRKRDKFCVEFAAEICLGETGGMTTPGQFKFILLSRGWKNA